MANYIDDASSYNYDATLTGTYTTDATNHTLTMGSDGEADTGFTLPSSTAWLLVETYDIDGTAGDIGGTWYQDTITSIDTDLSAYRAINTALVTATTYTSFKMKATWFDGTSTAKVFEADESTAFPDDASPSYTKTSWTPPTGTWKITDTLVAPVGIGDTIVTSTNDVVSSSGSVTTTNFTTTSVSLEVTVEEPSNEYRPWVRWVVSSTTIGNTYRIHFDITRQDGVDSLILVGIAVGGATTYPRDTLIVANGYQYDLVATSAATNLTFYFDGRKTFDFDLENLVAEDLGTL